MSPSPRATATIIRHIHLPSITPFHLAETLQSHLSSQILTYKKALSSPSPSSSPPPAPVPTILTFVPTPVFTTGRREHAALSADQLRILQAPLTPSRSTSVNQRRNPEWASVVPTLRGGQTTFHGPGQLVIYPILDLKPSPVPSPAADGGAGTPAYGRWPKGVSARCYVNLLEQATINTLGHWSLKGVRTENPGVWEEGGERKIAALGVHLRRNVTSYGVGLNIATDLAWFDRIVACGLVGKGVVSMRELGEETGAWEASGAGRVVKADDGGEAMMELDEGIEGKDGIRRKWLDTLQPKSGIQLRARLKPGIVGKTWAREFARGLLGKDGEEKVERVGIEDLGLDDEFLTRYTIETEPWRAAWEDDW
ncbi:uncharacterized protein L3040_005937 [Drepanopeziza brunnea f. sp. 'multigermtubi']|uniref:BPL/LPL catalytic domain-containing protein n=1 Tax=Marssonina brunnea f. sp. multigermtubi (strain MB_m1) TaxID=1072389 RepID=K1WID3_MARBU|nr:uncharacterized protein MBM_09820 [Drepanopeziza brunnea f. sp. 'multigermtubi' MB_m1]EKD11957.1 hypothetical protein MBM_09820 [Drepanopeziza brunnea f. sp. 'multigermtubi' MB_m1]KAJ5040279.1 hypothetical protein L3040_005937 [Drepanopeziza brunnea f. sp. 'multigermtubi']